MPMSVHDALEAWSEGRIPIERALDLTGCADVDELLRACDSSDVPRPARHPIEDGPGSSDRVDLLVRVLVGTERSTIIVSDPVTGDAIDHDVVRHGGEAGAAAAAVYAAVKRRSAKL